MRRGYVLFANPCQEACLHAHLRQRDPEAHRPLPRLCRSLRGQAPNHSGASGRGRAVVLGLLRGRLGALEART